MKFFKRKKKAEADETLAVPDQAAEVAEAFSAAPVRVEEALQEPELTPVPIPEPEHWLII